MSSGEQILGIYAEEKQTKSIKYLCAVMEEIFLGLT